MKAGIHPPYIISKVLCACGNTFETRSTKDIIKLEICSACHPFFTGQQKLVDTAGRVERFQKRFQATDGKTLVRKAVKPVRIKKIESVGAVAKKRVLTTAPKKADEKTDKSPAKKSAKKAA